MNKILLFLSVLILLSCDQRIKEQPVIVAKTDLNQPQKFFVTLLTKADRENKKLFLVFGSRESEICRSFCKYHHDLYVMNILDKHFIIARVDYNSTPGGKELFKTYGKIGMTTWSIIDLDETVIADSDCSCHGNIGYPDEKEEIEYYLQTIKLAAPSLTYDESEILKSKLKLYD